MSLLANLDLPVRNKRSELTDELFERLRAFVYKKTGIYFQDNKRYLLESRIGRRLSALKLPGSLRLQIDLDPYSFLSSGALHRLPCLQ